ncbi:phosphate-starvation-inducible PsiE family protein [Gluconobacter cerinus]|uniref:phosphate-starvation-inducible PsiE family protein n=1 Tax=Gluconobacter cerinus TaxID=38307 RepID=UPI001B8D5C5A|nr:phosphate-starvation-inducible PsiE family protein [Gluconobacter cerinus]MBS1040021.1 phosphate-starvation-inducible PsiE family protein [Gluconobacter cerinus]MBS1047012.1 phosphate-starvation-inducible PsiE family protein [Gluconobacter cerinus]
MIKNIPGFLKLARAFDLFEEAAMLILTLCITVVACVGLLHVVVAVVRMVLSTGLDPTDPGLLQALFGMFFTVLIALEFKHSILVMPGGQAHSMARMRSVLLIGMMATVRKFIVLDLNGVNVQEMAALSGAVLALGIVYWLVRGKITQPLVDGSGSLLSSIDADH